MDNLMKELYAKSRPIKPSIPIANVNNKTSFESKIFCF